MWKKQGSWNFFHAKLIPNSSNIILSIEQSDARKEHVLDIYVLKKSHNFMYDYRCIKGM